MLLRTLVLAILLGLSWTLSAHPHVWIDLRVKPLVNEQGELIALQQAWRFDPFYSLILIEELEKGGPAEELEERMDQLAVEVVRNLQNFDFFTRVSVEGRRHSLEPVKSFNLMQAGRRIEFNFVLPLADPVDLTHQQFSYQVFDPSYYIEILHARGLAPDADELGANCQVKLVAPNPSQDLIEKALALDESDTPEDPMLGEHFTETVYIKCGD